MTMGGMPFRRILITGGAGFVGANQAVLLRKPNPVLMVHAFDFGSWSTTGSKATVLEQVLTPSRRCAA
jgi:hypothetical protein